jgi:hypothetical protein
MDLTSNYTGAYWSDGKFQPSVPYGISTPTSALDASARLHDTAYALYPNDKSVKFYADATFKQQSDKMPGVKAAVAGQAVTKGNILINGAKNLASNLVRFGPLGAVKSVVENIQQAQHLIDDKKRAVAVVKNIAANDPMIRKPVPKMDNPVVPVAGVKSSVPPNQPASDVQSFVYNNTTTRGKMTKKSQHKKSNKILPSNGAPSRKSTNDVKPKVPEIVNNITLTLPEVRDKYYLDTANGIRIPYTRKEYEKQTIKKPKHKKFKAKKITKAAQKAAFDRLTTQQVLQNI